MKGLEARIRKIRRDFFIASGFETMEGTSTLFLSQDIWDQYCDEAKMHWASSSPKEGDYTFEGVEIIVLDGNVTDLICYMPKGTSARL